MLGPAPGSWPVIVLAANWLAEGGFANKWQLLRKNTPALGYLLIFCLALIGLIYTSDFNWAFNLLRINLPLLAVPLVVFSSAPLSQKEFRTLLFVFLAGCFFNVAWCHIYDYLYQTQQHSRKVSRFMSHIRLGLFVNMAIPVSTYFVVSAPSSTQRLLAVLLLLVFVVSLFTLGLASGLVLFTLLLLAGFIWYLIRLRKAQRLTGFVLLVVVMGLGIYYFFSIAQQQLSVKRGIYNVPKDVNSQGRPLIHFDTAGHVENGNYVFSNLQLEDLQKHWNLRAPDDTFSLATTTNLERYYLLIRYLASCGYSKDAEGVKQLSQRDVANIRAGVPNYLYPEWGYLRKRVYELINEYQDFKNNGESNGHSLTMRFYYWQAALKAIKIHPLLGVGTGDTQIELEKIYAESFPKLKPEWYKHPHNQYLSMAVAFGLCGLLVFLWALLYPAWMLRRHLHVLFWAYFAMLLVSFLTEDTLESQAGMMFFVCFGVFFQSQALVKKQQIPAG